MGTVVSVRTTPCGTLQCVTEAGRPSHTGGRAYEPHVELDESVVEPLQTHVSRRQRSLHVRHRVDSLTVTFCGCYVSERNVAAAHEPQLLRNLGCRNTAASRRCSHARR